MHTKDFTNKYIALEQWLDDRLQRFLNWILPVKSVVVEAPIDAIFQHILSNIEHADNARECDNCECMIKTLLLDKHEYMRVFRKVRTLRKIIEARKAYLISRRSGTHVKFSNN